MKRKVTKADTIADLQLRNKELEAQLIHNYHFASHELDKFSTDHCMGSAVILELTVLGGKRFIKPVSISDGLSPETIAAIQADLVRSFEQKILFKPKGAKK